MFAFSGDEASNRGAVCKNCGDGGCKERDGGGDDDDGGEVGRGGLVVHIRVTKHIDFSPMATLFTSESHKTATNKQAPEICHTSLVPWSSTRVIRNEGIFYGYMHISKSKGP